MVRIARPTNLLAIWHCGRSHRRPNRSRSPNQRHFAWVFVDALKWVFGCKNGSKVGRNPLVTHTLNPFRDFRENPCALFSHFQKNPRVRKIFCPQFWGRTWLREFYGRLEKCVLSAGKPMSIKFVVLGGGGFFLGFGGGGVPILFLWAPGFF